MERGAWPEEVLKALANPTNQAILNLLVVEPTYPRRVGDLLSLSETEAARRLKHMETLGLVGGEWTYIGKNVKLYKLRAEGLTLDFTPQGLRVEIAGRKKESASATLNPLVMRVPELAGFVGRSRELTDLAGSQPVMLVVGLPGIGKTSLIARFAQEQSATRAVFWHAFRGVESLAWLANRLAVFSAQHGNRELLAAIERGAEIADQRELMLAVLRDERVAFVLDDMHRVQDAVVRDFMGDAVAQTTRGKLVLGSREPPSYDPTLAHVRTLSLGGLDDEAVLRFFDERSFKVDPKLLPRVRTEVGGHPLALALLIEAAREEGDLEGLLDRIPERGLEEYLLREVDGGLSEDERRVLAHASVFRTTFSQDDLRAVTQKDPLPQLLRLRRRLLVTPAGDSFALHEVVRNYFYNLLQDRRTFHERAALHYLAEGTIEARFEAMHHLLEAGLRSKVLRLLEENLDLREFDFIDAGYQDLYLSVLELFPREEVDDDRRWALITDEKGDIRFHRGEYEAALKLYDEALPVFRDAKEGSRAADLCWKRAMAHARLGGKRAAKEALSEGLTWAAEGSLERKRLTELSGTL